MVKRFIAGGTLAVVTAATLGAQAPQQSEAEQVRARQRIATMEAVLERAVSNGADNVLRQVKNVMPDQPMLAGAPRVRGFRLDGYGVFFDVEVPLLRLPIMWPLRYMVHDNRTARTVQELRAEIRQLQPADRERFDRVLRDLELQLQVAQAGQGRPRGPEVSAATTAAGAPEPLINPDVVTDPENAYTREVMDALIDAMLENSGALAIGAEEWLTVAARDNAPRDPLIPGDTIDFSTWIFRVKGSDLAAFRAGRITAEEARKKVETREY